MELIKYTIDGERSGIIVKIINGSKKPAYITGSNNRYRIFNNLEVAKVMAHTLLPDNKFEYYIKIGKKMIPISDCRKIGDTWEFFDEKGDLYQIKELRRRRTSSLGYICFDNGDEKRCDRQYGEEFQKVYFDGICNALTEIFLNNGDYSITGIKAPNRKEYVVSVRGTTGKIRICYGSKLMDINQARRNGGEKCFPFIKQVDKYLCFYICTDRDISESQRTKFEEKMNNIKDQMMDILVRDYADHNPTYLPVDRGYIEFEEVK